jgi:hypothetical protein
MNKKQQNTLIIVILVMSGLSLIVGLNGITKNYQNTESIDNYKKLILKEKTILNSNEYKTPQSIYDKSLSISKEFALKAINYSNMAGWNKIKSEKIILPTHQNGTIAFDYMETYIKELEAERIKELEAYLKVTGLNDYILTDEEQQLIKDFRDGGVISWSEFRAGDLFTIATTQSFNKDKLTPVSKDNYYPYITRTSENNGELAKTGIVDGIKLNDENTFSLGLLQMNFFWQQKQWYAGQFVRVIKPNNNYDKNSMLYFQSIFKPLEKILLQGAVRTVNNNFSNFMIKLPSKNNQPDYDLMNKYIRTIEKLVIKGVVEWKDKQIETMNKVINE